MHRRRTSPRRLAGTLTVVTLVGALLAVPGDAPAQATEAPEYGYDSATAATHPSRGIAVRGGAARAPQTAAAEGPVAVVPESITPRAPGPGSTLRVTGHLTAVGQRVADVSVRLRFSSGAFVSRGVMNAYAQGGATDRIATTPLYDTQKQVTEQLAAGESVPFSVSVPVNELALDDFGVHPLTVEVLSGDQPVAEKRTFMPFVPEDFQAAPTRATWLWPIIDRPHRALDTGFVDDRLSAEISSEGRLGRLVGAAASAPAPPEASRFPLVWAVDPALLRAVQDMKDGYEVRDPASDEVTKHGDSSVAKEWLGDLKEAVGDQTVLSMPYADPDVMAMHRAGLDDTISLAITSGPALTEKVLEREVTPDVVWPPGGWLDQDTLDTLALAGTNTVIVNEQSLPAAAPQTYTPNAATRIKALGGPVNVLVADSTLTRILDSATRAPGSAALARQRFLAETALITDERPYEKNTLLIAPPHRWNPPPGFAASTLAASAQVPWLRTVGLPYLLNHPSDVDMGDLRYPPVARAQELKQKYLAKVKAAYKKLERFSSILETRATSFDYALLRTESAAWREHPVTARRLRDMVRLQLKEKRGAVHILAKKKVVLASNAATVPITIANNLTDPDLAVTVGLEVRPENRARLDVSRVDDRIEIQPERKATVRVRMEAVSSGVIDVVLQLKTPDGRDYGEPVHLKVHATGYGTAAVAVTGGALAVLFLAVAVRLVRRTLRHGSESDTEEPT